MLVIIGKIDELQVNFGHDVKIMISSVVQIVFKYFEETQRREMKERKESVIRNYNCKSLSVV